MARDNFTDTIGLTDGSGFYKPLGNVQVSVYQPGTTTLVTIYLARTGTTQKANPFTTTTGGAVEFWAEYGDYDIAFHDLNIPARISDKTIGWNAINGAASATPSDRIAPDGNLSYASLGAVAVRQDVPIGGKIDWWRPDASVPVPTGYAICDGSTVTAANHDFPGIAGSIVLPDCRNAFTLGANISNADNQAATAGDTAGAGPGIRGSGGTNERDFAHVHTLAHTHTVPAHSHTMAHTHPFGALSSYETYATGGSVTAPAGGLRHTHGILGTTGASSTGSTGAAGALTTSGASVTNTGSALTDNVDMRSKYVGMLAIIKIKRN